MFGQAQAVRRSRGTRGFAFRIADPASTRSSRRRVVAPLCGTSHRRIIRVLRACGSAVLGGATVVCSMCRWRLSINMASRQNASSLATSRQHHVRQQRPEQPRPPPQRQHHALRHKSPPDDRRQRGAGETAASVSVVLEGETETTRIHFTSARRPIAVARMATSTRWIVQQISCISTRHSTNVSALMMSRTVRIPSAEHHHWLRSHRLFRQSFTDYSVDKLKPNGQTKLILEKKAEAHSSFVAK